MRMLPCSSADDHPQEASAVRTSSRYHASPSSRSSSSAVSVAAVIMYAG
ncbi:hypothetical protein [Streptomyces sp. NPDC051173]